MLHILKFDYAECQGIYNAWSNLSVLQCDGSLVVWKYDFCVEFVCGLYWLLEVGLVSNNNTRSGGGEEGYIINISRIIIKNLMT